MEVEISRMTERGQVTIPQEFRQKLKLKKGAKILFFKEDGKLILEPMNRMNLKKLKEDLEFARRTELAWKDLDKGESITQSADEFLNDMKKWAKE